VLSYNSRRGCKLGSRGKSNLLLPIAMLQNFFTPVVSKIINSVRELLAVMLLLIRVIASNNYADWFERDDFSPASF
jgi:hypothetical protein